MTIDPDFEYELESQEYWDQVEFVLQFPMGHAANHPRPMMEFLPAYEPPPARLFQ